MFRYNVYCVHHFMLHSHNVERMGRTGRIPLIPTLKWSGVFSRCLALFSTQIQYQIPFCQHGDVILVWNSGRTQNYKVETDMSSFFHLAGGNCGVNSDLAWVQLVSMLTFWPDDGARLILGTVLTVIHPLGNLNVWAKFHGNSFSGCWDFSLGQSGKLTSLSNLK